MRTAIIGLLDALVAVISIYLAAWFIDAFVHPGVTAGFERATTASVATVLATMLGSYLMGLHEASVVTEAKQVVSRTALVGALAGLTGVLTLYAVFFLPKGRLVVLLTAALVSLGLGAWRLIYGRYLLSGPRLPVLILGTGTSAIRFADLINRARHTRYVAVGFVGETTPQGHDLKIDLPYFGSPEQAPQVCKEHGISVVAVTTNGETPKWFRMLGTLQLDGVRVTTSGAISTEVAKQIPLDIVSSEYLLNAFERLDRPAAARVKRTLDIGIALVGLAGFATLFPLLYGLVKANSPGPFFYSQQRLGQGGRCFTLHKIRTMSWAPRNSEQRWASESDPRVTRIGKYLRQFRLDELPQFWNVLRGDMSVVGPRPEQPELARAIEEKLPAFAYRTLVKPGITGWAQIRAGYASNLDDSAEKLAHDLYYVQRYSGLLDCAIILRTIHVMLARVGAR